VLQMSTYYKNTAVVRANSSIKIFNIRAEAVTNYYGLTKQQHFRAKYIKYIITYKIRLFIISIVSLNKNRVQPWVIHTQFNWPNHQITTGIFILKDWQPLLNIRNKKTYKKLGLAQSRQLSNIQHKVFKAVLNQNPNTIEHYKYNHSIIAPQDNATKKLI
jgi:hypothetical protein